jgi:hypothetical protein
MKPVKKKPGKGDAAQGEEFGGGFGIGAVYLARRALDK